LLPFDGGNSKKSHEITVTQWCSRLRKMLKMMACVL
jgi:hypothetical protein